MLSNSQVRQFAEEGFLVVTGLLDVATVIEPTKQPYTDKLDQLAHILMGQTNSDLQSSYATRAFADRVAILLGCSGSSVLGHLDPSLAILARGYRRQSDLPSAQRPEMFRLLTDARLLDALETLVGPEIHASPIYHVNLKLAETQRKLAARISAASKQRLPVTNPLWDFQVGKTQWHTDAAYGLPNARHSRIVNAWIPMTEATPENGCLLVEPGSQRLDPSAEKIDETGIVNPVAVPAAPGDVVFMHNNILHASTKNVSAGDVRWAFNFRYLPPGEPTGRPFLPGFIARSRRAPELELRDPELWSEMWRAALDFHSRHSLADELEQVRDAADADALTARWNAVTPNHADWLRLDARITP
jgi:hypothetical protein